VGLEPTHWCLTNTCSAAELPTQTESAQRESNPHIRPGETVRCDYVIGAFCPDRIVKESIPKHRVGLEPTFYRNLLPQSAFMLAIARQPPLLPEQ
jgi:hypothetical protein